jgi:hypothetical protein
MTEDLPPNSDYRNHETRRLPASPTIPFPEKAQRATPNPQDAPAFQLIPEPLDPIKRSEYRVPEPEKEGVFGIISAVIAVLAIFIGFGVAYWWLRR